MVMRVMERKGANGRAQSKLMLPKLHAVIYSSTLKAVPSGSTPFVKLEKINTKPTNQRAIILIVLFVVVSFIMICVGVLDVDEIFVLGLTKCHVIGVGVRLDLS